jgi:hypothetical protein
MITLSGYLIVASPAKASEHQEVGFALKSGSEGVFHDKRIFEKLDL